MTCVSVYNERLVAFRVFAARAFSARNAQQRLECGSIVLEAGAGIVYNSERETKVHPDWLKKEGIAPQWRDFCAHLLIPLNQCRSKTFHLPWKCKEERHAYEHCEHVECVMKHLSGRFRQPWGGFSLHQCECYRWIDGRQTHAGTEKEEGRRRVKMKQLLTMSGILCRFFRSRACVRVGPIIISTPLRRVSSPDRRHGLTKLVSRKETRLCPFPSEPSAAAA